MLSKTKIYYLTLFCKIYKLEDSVETEDLLT